MIRYSMAWLPYEIEKYPEVWEKIEKGYPSVSINLYVYDNQYNIRPLLISNRYNAENKSIFVHQNKNIISLCLHKEFKASSQITSIET